VVKHIREVLLAVAAEQAAEATGSAPKVVWPWQPRGQHTLAVRLGSPGD
jgi:hypothetical protein